MGKIYGPYLSSMKDGFSRKPFYFYRVSGLEKTQALTAMLWFMLGSYKRQHARDVLARVPRTCHRGHPKEHNHAGCGQCTADYWQARRDAKRNSTAEPAQTYLIA